MKKWLLILCLLASTSSRGGEGLEYQYGSPFLWMAPLVTAGGIAMLVASFAGLDYTVVDNCEFTPESCCVSSTNRSVIIDRCMQGSDPTCAPSINQKYCIDPRDSSNINVLTSSKQAVGKSWYAGVFWSGLGVMLASLPVGVLYVYFAPLVFYPFSQRRVESP